MNARIQSAAVGQTETGSNRGATPHLNRMGNGPGAVFRRRLRPSGWTLRKAALVAFAGALVVCGVGTSNASAASVSLVLPQSTAFAILGHSCGGIQEKAYASGFDPVSGFPTGDVYIQTRCGGSGRGGGYRATTYSAWVSVTWNFSGNAVSSAKLLSTPAVNPSFSAVDAFGDALNNANSAAYLTVPAPKEPIGVTAAQSGDQAAVSWTPDGVNPAAIISSTLVATDVASASVVTTTVNGTAANGLVGPLQPQTTYNITVVNTTIGGSSPASPPIPLTTAAASMTPSAPTGVKAYWTSLDPITATDTLVATWNAAAPGDSPIDEYEITITGSDGGGTFKETVSGTTLTAMFTVDYTPNWTVTVRAHNAAGWGPASTPFTLGGL